ncbi:hypothetical protein EMCRGX_G033394 [Ephydatia muelleri]
MESATIVVVMVVLSMVDARPKAMDIAAGPIRAQNELDTEWDRPDQTNVDSTYEATLEDMMLRYLRAKMFKAHDKQNKHQAEEVNADDIKKTMIFQATCCTHPPSTQLQTFSGL